MRDIAEAFRGHLAGALGAHLPAEPALARFIAALGALDCSAPRAPAARPAPATVAAHLDAALDGLDPGHRLSGPVRDLAGHVGWYQIFEGAGIDPALARGLVAGQMAGQVGLVAAEAIRSGLFLLAPGVHYPLHQHEAEEIYFVVSGALTLQHGRQGAPFTLGPGDCSVTPPHRVHALTTGAQPCLIVYAWIGAVEAPNWWWEEDPDGTWHRHCWRRQPDARWLKGHREPVSAAVLREAGEG